MNPSPEAKKIALALLEELAGDNGAALAFDDENGSKCKAHNDDENDRMRPMFFVRPVHRNILERAVHRACLAGFTKTLQRQDFIEEFVSGPEEDRELLIQELPNPHFTEIGECMDAIFNAEG